jgi:hypothetical protein
VLKGVVAPAGLAAELAFARWLARNPRFAEGFGRSQEPRLLIKSMLGQAVGVAVITAQRAVFIPVAAFRASLARLLEHDVPLLMVADRCLRRLSADRFDEVVRSLSAEGSIEVERARGEAQLQSVDACKVLHVFEAAEGARFTVDASAVTDRHVADMMRQWVSPEGGAS